MKESIKERFMRHVSPEPNSGCWLWTSLGDGRGYGKFSLQGKRRRAHRVAYDLFVGPIPDDAHVLHHCDVPCCVNPAHLWVGTHTDNMRDCCRKGRKAQQKKTHCPQGHPYDAENTCHAKSGDRRCRACSREYYHRNKVKP